MSNSIDKIKTEEFRNEWAIALMQKGIVVRLSISRWSGFSRITPEELGLKFSDDSRDFMKKYLNLGSEKLLPPHVLNEIRLIERNAKVCLEEHSFDTVWGKFVPYNAFDSWEEQNNIHKNMFFDFAREFANKYDNIIDMVRSEYRKLGIDVWHRLYPNSGSPTESFLTDFSEKIVKKIPSVTEIVSSFKYETVFFVIPVPSIIQADIAAAQDIVRNQSIKQIESELEIRTKQRIAQEFISKKTEFIDGFLQSTVSSLRQYVEDLCKSVLTSLGKNSVNDLNKIHQKKILAMIEKVKLLNFYDDEKITDLLLNLEIETKKVKGERNKDVITSTLEKIVQVATDEFSPKNFNPSIDYMDL